MKVDSVIFYTKNFDEVIEFYKDKIGFEVGFIAEGKFASFKFENTNLGIKNAVEEREVPGSQTIIIGTDNVKKKYEGIQRKGIKIYKELTEDSFGANFSFLDVDGNKVQFIERM